MDGKPIQYACEERAGGLICRLERERQKGMDFYDFQLSKIRRCI
jgi:hypothetical protein